ncbi:MAG: hypothetical protein Q7S42_03735 [Candidatus Omnitrophota bacterium]|nr:hypothetical protein [Candidatus Omnitrophota bacterium]
MKKRFLILLLVLGFPISIFAETIILKSGKTVEGKIIEKTDKYIKIDFQSVPLTYFTDEIESIDGKKIVLTASSQLVNKSVVPPTQSNNTTEKSQLVSTGLGYTESNQGDTTAYKDWEKRTDVSTYFKSQGALNRRENEGMSQLISSLKEAQEKNDLAQIESITARIEAEYSAILQDAKILKPPSEFESFHYKVIEHYNNMIMFYKGVLRKDHDAVIKFGQYARRSMGEALEILKKIYIRHGAPPEAIVELDRGLNTLKR